MQLCFACILNDSISVWFSSLTVLICAPFMNTACIASRAPRVSRVLRVSCSCYVEVMWCSLSILCCRESGVGVESARRLIIISSQTFESKFWKSLFEESTDKIDIGPLASWTPASHDDSTRETCFENMFDLKTSNSRVCSDFKASKSRPFPTFNSKRAIYLQLFASSITSYLTSIELFY